MRLLAIDTASPTSSVAVGVATESGATESGATESGTTVESREIELRRTSERLLPTIDELLAARGWRLADLDGMVGLAGPGSFTGLRIGLATLYGLHQATGIPATAIPTLDVLAATAEEEEVVAAVDSLRGEWLAAPYRHGRATAPARLVAAAELASGAVGLGPVVAAGAAAFGDPRLREPPPLAAVGLRLAASGRLGDPSTWDGSTLTRPLYARPPATTAPRPPKTVLVPGR